MSSCTRTTAFALPRSIGGIVTKVLSDTVKTDPMSDAVKTTKTIDAFGPGEIRIGPNWDPFGESREDLGQNWWRALAHEYGHYMLFMPDNYLGLKEDNNTLTKVDCKGSFMTTAYDPAYEKLLSFAGENLAGWSDDCKHTLAAQPDGPVRLADGHQVLSPAECPDRRYSAQDHAARPDTGHRHAGQR